ncbi:MAG TPA: hypothetical protein VFA79_06325 [Myxococcales bacterium]|nr:hypothetical protein [Myxococcales bacterium]
MNARIETPTDYGFLLKDVVLLGAAVVLGAESLRAAISARSR